jgi:hypothetical protein
MRALILGALLVVFVVAANSPHHGAPPSITYPDCAATVTYPVTNPGAYCTFHGSPVTVGQYVDMTIPNAR